MLQKRMEKNAPSIFSRMQFFSLLVSKLRTGVAWARVTGAAVTFDTSLLVATSSVICYKTKKKTRKNCFVNVSIQTGIAERLKIVIYDFKGFPQWNGIMNPLFYSGIRTNLMEHDEFFECRPLIFLINNSGSFDLSKFTKYRKFHNLTLISGSFPTVYCLEKHKILK